MRSGCPGTPFVARVRPARRALTVLGWADLTRSTGAGYMWRRIWLKRRLREEWAGVRDTVYAGIWRDAAAALGAELSERPGGVLELRRGNRVTRVRQQFVELDGPAALAFALDKPRVHERLRAAGLPIPEHREFGLGDRGAAVSFLRAGGAHVVKPASGTGGGNGTTAGVRTPAQLRRAGLRAARASTRLLVERQVEGDVYRLLLLDGELLDVVRNRPPRVTGDGRATVEQLITAENERRIAARGDGGLTLIAVGLDVMFELERLGLGLRSVLRAGETIAVQSVTNDNGVRDSETFTGPISLALLASARAAVEVVGLRLAGVDVITTDPGRPLEETGGVILEVNGSPGLHHHYHVADPDGATHVAVPILRELLHDHTRTGDHR